MCGLTLVTVDYLPVVKGYVLSLDIYTPSETDYSRSACVTYTLLSTHHHPNPWQVSQWKLDTTCASKMMQVQMKPRVVQVAHISSLAHCHI